MLLDDGISSYLYGPSLAPIAQIDNATGAVQYLHSDLIGSTRVITDSAGAAVGITQYDEYGNRTAHAGAADSEFGFSGNWTDPDTGFVYLRARDYDTTTGQFTTVDPAVDSTRQPYAYAANNPLQNIDPTGLDFWGDVGNNGLAFGAGLLDSATFGLSGAVLGAVVPGYNCLTEGNPWFTAGVIVGTIAVGLATAGVGAGVAIAAIAARTAIKVAVKTAVSASQRVVTGGVVRAPARLGAAATQSATKSGTNVVNEGIYVVRTEIGGTYTGQSGNIAQRLPAHVRQGKFTQAEVDGAVRTEVLGGKTAREIAEQLKLDSLGGRDAPGVLNKVNPIGESRMELMPPGYSR
ncbi:RHS repeat-associated core domain-containing protein [Salinibacterium sp. SWN167]|uniref:RHS repeat-associated core domain-containing protein n=1 Tax=Salinibacterium sp. SWN167 TaxID=2792054 RepID=UPI0018CEB2E4|nr:RHS repeat-associated core domain-containing protein [Salinibacterium sp. SWN167]MBH0083985.1 RHS repeat-associated core domain-containing protein [Salinibacterium sp. SWN167]